MALIKCYCGNLHRTHVIGQCGTPRSDKPTDFPHSYEEIFYEGMSNNLVSSCRWCKRTKDNRIHLGV